MLANNLPAGHIFRPGQTSDLFLWVPLYKSASSTSRSYRSLAFFYPAESSNFPFLTIAYSSFGFLCLRQFFGRVSLSVFGLIRVRQYIDRVLKSITTQSILSQSPLVVWPVVGWGWHTLDMFWSTLCYLYLLITSVWFSSCLAFVIVPVNCFMFRLWCTIGYVWLFVSSFLWLNCLLTRESLHLGQLCDPMKAFIWVRFVTP